MPSPVAVADHYRERYCCLICYASCRAPHCTHLIIWPAFVLLGDSRLSAGVLTEVAMLAYASQCDHDNMHAPQLFGSFMRRTYPITMREETGCCVPHGICGRTIQLQYEFCVQRTRCQLHESGEEDRRCNTEPGKVAR